jgi:hypothetical protein
MIFKKQKGKRCERERERERERFEEQIEKTKAFISIKTC